VAFAFGGVDGSWETDDNMSRSKGFQEFLARRTDNTDPKVAGILDLGNRTNVPVQAELLFRENGPGGVFGESLSSRNGKVLRVSTASYPKRALLALVYPTTPT
jgi:hypothetical protein